MTTLLAIGDMHLGRPPAALPEDLHQRRDRLGPETAWSRAVDEAITRGVDGVLLAGDVVEQSRDFFVAYGQLKSGIEQLAEAGITVIAVAGNHDTHVLPRLAAEIDGLHLLGADGQWEEASIGRTRILGWSFPQPQVRRSPLETLKHKRRRNPVIGLLHCDRDQAGSAYAPVTGEQLEQAPVDAWLLGHIHRPDRLDDERPMGYLGSVTALRSSETGARGPWLIEVEKGRIRANQLALAPLRFEPVDIDCSELEQADQLGERILEACRSRIAAFSELEYQPEAVGFRITLTGQTPVANALPGVVNELLEDGRSWEEAGSACFLHRIDIATLPKLDLKRLARQSDPCGLLARRIVALEDPASEEYQRLIELGRSRLARIVQSREFRELEYPLSDRAVADWLRQAGLRALTELVEQRGENR